MQETNFFDHLPREIKLDIFKLMPTLNDICNVARVCKEWQALVRNDHMGRQIMKRFHWHIASNSFSYCIDHLKELFNKNFIHDNKTEIEIVKKMNEKDGGNFIDFLELLNWYSATGFICLVDQNISNKEALPPISQKHHTKKWRCVIQ